MAGSHKNRKDAAVGPDFFEKYVFEYEKKLIDHIHKQGAMIIDHNCGYARSLWRLYKNLEMDVFETLTEAPFGDGDIDAAILTTKHCTDRCKKCTKWREFAF